MNVYTRILHYDEGTSDKIYISEINHLNNEFVVTTHWGPRDAAVLTSRIQGSFRTRSQADSAAYKKEREKLNKGYKDIAKNLTVRGFKRNAVSVVDIAKDTSHASKESITTAAPTKRKISI